MLKFNRKNLILSALIGAGVAFLAASISAIQAPALDILKSPLMILSAMQREAEGLVFYHHNYLQNERLKSEVSRLRAGFAGYNEMSRENRRLSALLGFKQNSPYRLAACRVVGRAPDNWSSLVIIDKGSFHGLKRGMVVVNGSGLVGRVAQAGNSLSKVALINDPEVSVSCLDARSRQEGLVSGLLGNSLIMKYLPREADIRAGDAVVTSGLTDAFPKGLAVGKVVEVGEEFSGLTRFAIIRPEANLSSLEEVLVILE